MATESPFVIRVYDKARQWQGNIGAPQALSGSILQHAAGSFQLTLDPADPMLDDVMAKGSRIAIDYLDAPLFSGMRRPFSGALTSDGNVQCTIEGDRRVLNNHMALVVPTSPLLPTSISGTGPARLAQAVQTDAAGASGTVQGQTGYMVWPAEVSTAEAAIKYILGANLGRAFEPTTIKPNLNRGGDARAAGVLPQVRMAKLSEAIQPILDWSGLTLVALRSVLGTIEIDVREPEVWPGRFSVDSGVVTGGSWSIAPPSATRVILGGPGQDAARAFWQVNDQTGLEAEYGDSIEVFKDATGATLTWPQSLDQVQQVAKYYLLRTDVTAANKALFRAYLDQAGRDALADGAALTSIAATLSETEDFHALGLDGIQLGDEMTVTAANGVDFPDVVTEVKVAYTAADGVKVTPILGDLSDSPDRTQARLIARLFAAMRRQAQNR